MTCPTARPSPSCRTAAAVLATLLSPLLLAAPAHAQSAQDRADLLVGVSGPEQGVAGSTALWSVLVANRGSAEAAPGFVLSGQLPDDVTVVSVTRTEGWSCASTGLECTRTRSIPPGGFVLSVLDVELAYGPQADGARSVQVSVSPAAGETALDDNRATATTLVQPAPAPTLPAPPAAAPASGPAPAILVPGAPAAPAVTLTVPADVTRTVPDTGPTTATAGTAAPAATAAPVATAAAAPRAATTAAGRATAGTAEPVADADADAGTGTAAGADAGTGTDVRTDVRTDAVTDFGMGAGTDAGTDADIGTDAAAVPGTDAATDPSPGAPAPGVPGALPFAVEEREHQPGPQPTDGRLAGARDAPRTDRTDLVLASVAALGAAGLVGGWARRLRSTRVDQAPGA